MQSEHIVKVQITASYKCAKILKCTKNKKGQTEGIKNITDCH